MSLDPIEHWPRIHSEVLEEYGSASASSVLGYSHGDSHGGSHACLAPYFNPSKQSQKAGPQLIVQS